MDKVLYIDHFLGFLAIAPDFDWQTLGSSIHKHAERHHAVPEVAVVPGVGMVLVDGEKAQGEEGDAVLGTVVLHQVDGGVLSNGVDGMVAGKRKVARGIVGNDGAIVVVPGHVARGLRKDNLLASDTVHPVEHIECAYSD